MSENKKQDLERSKERMSQEFLPNFPFKYKNTGPLKHARIHETNTKDLMTNEGLTPKIEMEKSW